MASCSAMKQTPLKVPTSGHDRRCTTSHCRIDPFRHVFDMAESHDGDCTAYSVDGIVHASLHQEAYLKLKNPVTHPPCQGLTIAKYTGHNITPCIDFSVITHSTPHCHHCIDEERTLVNHRHTQHVFKVDHDARENSQEDSIQGW